MRSLRDRKTTLLHAIASALALFAIAIPARSQIVNGSVAYTYDALGRVTTASYDTGVCIVYKYDPNGNRTSETINVTVAGATGVWGCFNWNNTGSAKWGS